MNLIENEVYETVKAAIYPEYLESTKLIFVPNKSSYNSLIIEAQSTVYRTGYDAKVLFARLKTEGKTRYISFSELQKKYIDDVYVYTKTKSDPFLRISIEDFIATTKNSEKARKALNEIFLSVFNFTSFGCCSRYKDCSNEGKCIHPDLIYAAACQYKKNLDDGKNFYKDITE